MRSATSDSKTILEVVFQSHYLNKQPQLLTRPQRSKQPQSLKQPQLRTRIPPLPSVTTLHLTTPQTLHLTIPPTLHLTTSQITSLTIPETIHWNILKLFTVRMSKSKVLRQWRRQLPNRREFRPGLKGLPVLSPLRKLQIQIHTFRIKATFYEHQIKMTFQRRIKPMVKRRIKPTLQRRMIKMSERRLEPRLIKTLSNPQPREQLERGLWTLPLQVHIQVDICCAPLHFSHYSRHSVNGPSVTGIIQLTDFYPSVN